MTTSGAAAPSEEEEAKLEKEMYDIIDKKMKAEAGNWSSASYEKKADIEVEVARLLEGPPGLSLGQKVKRQKLFHKANCKWMIPKLETKIESIRKELHRYPSPLNTGQLTQELKNHEEDLRRFKMLLWRIEKDQQEEKERKKNTQL